MSDGPWDDGLMQRAEVRYQEMLSEAMSAYWAEGNAALPLRSSERMAQALEAAARAVEELLPSEEQAPLLRRAMLQAIGVLKGPGRSRAPAGCGSVVLEDGEC